MIGDLFARSKRTNEVVRSVNGIRRKRLGTSGIEVSEVGLGTQRWGSTDFNAPDEALCHAMLDLAVANGVNLVDTAEQYPIPSSRERPEGLTEEIIGRWLAKHDRSSLVIASKITGGRNVNRISILRDCEGSLRRLGTDYLDVYLLHWPARYTPQSNWGQSLEYDWNYGVRAVPSAASFDEIVEAMELLMDRGKIRGYGACNDNAVGLMGMAQAGVPPCAMQNDYSILNRRIEENGLSEASSPALSNCGFMAYNVLAGGMLTGKYDDPPAAVDDAVRDRAQRTAKSPRGRMDDRGWGMTLGRYRTTAARAAIAQYEVLAKDYGMTIHDLALRFVASRPAVTTSLVGHTSLFQLEETLAAFRKGPLPPQLLWEIDRVHLQNRLPLFSNDKTGPDWGNEGLIGERIP
ncbi:hypothetical protein CTAYLR_009270 [Chrysophaeum taylorii]|uniref:NADP-dependent oxidoreductase domain-containing protein n=1 Tax=Chrysophaeum taylorii TaxID=2483200 RepID=A0AAD7UK55_9STRA|nr:hypothetical protein CTAYLR_009270 [Chrysophaeum taylorii]